MSRSVTREETGIRIDLDKLQLLLNIIDNRITVSYPLFQFDFFSAEAHEAGYRLKLTCSETDFNREKSKFGGQFRELPSYSDLRAGLLSSGVIGFTNMKEFKEKLNSYRKLSKDVKFSLDTNLLYFRFLSNYELIKPSEIVLVTTVGDEIKAKLNYKYSQGLLSSNRSISGLNKELLNELHNKRVKRSRKAAYIALNEYKDILDGVADEVEEVEKSSPDSRNNDIIIVKTLAKFERAGHTLPVLLTADDAVADLCNAEGVEYFKFDQPHKINIAHCSIKQLIALIFNLATVFGFIKINSVIIFGEFRGKSSNHPDELKLLFLNQKLQGKFDMDLRICRRLMELGIER